MNNILTRPQLGLPLFLLVAFLFTGCGLTNEITLTRKAIEKESSVETYPSMVVSLGPGLFQTTSMVTRMVDDQDAQTVSRIANGVRRVKASVYALKARSDYSDLELPELNRFKKKGWKTAAKVEDVDAVSWIMYRERKNKVKDIFVVVVTDDELVLARVQGSLTELLDTTLDELEYGDSDFFDNWDDWDY